MDIYKLKKNIFKKAALVCGAALMLNSCGLDEFNPAAGSGGDVLKSFDNWSGMVTYCYEPLYGQLFSAFDYFAVAEGGTDLWQTANNKTWASEVFHYEGLTTNTNYTNKLFKQAYSQINTCNSVIEVADEVTGGNAADVQVLKGEALCLRAYYYSILVTNYGEVTLTTKSSQDGATLNPQRNTYAELYAQMVADLKEASELLGTTPYNGDYARVTKKTALGLLARVYAQGAAEDLTENGVSYWQRAKEVAEDLISNASTYGAALYDDVEDVWASANNKSNKEALFIAAGPSDKTAANYAQSNIFTYMFCNPYKLNDVYKTADKSNYFLGRVNNNILAPSKYLIDLFDADNDKRWENTFMCAFGHESGVQPGWSAYNNKNTYLIITSALATKYGIDQTHVGDTIWPYADYNYVAGVYNQYPAKVWKKNSDHTGNTANLYDPKNVYVIDYPVEPDDDRFVIYLSKKTLSAEEKAKYSCVTVNIDDLFDADGQYNSASFDNTNTYQLYPGLVKSNWNYDGVFTSNLQKKTGDVFIMRMAEIYLIAAEANVELGNASKAAEQLNVLRKRACRSTSNFDSTMKLTTADEQTVLDEYARELVGEFQRWAVLKRHGYTVFMNQLKKGNLRASKSFSEKNMLRPISYDFLNQIENAEEYGTNGY
jgi:hypothetical protein